MKKVLWLTNIPSPYRVDFFNMLGLKVKLKVIFERKESSERKDSWYGNEFKHFDYVFLKGIKFGSDRSISISVINHLCNNFDYIFISNPMTPTGMIASRFLRAFRIPFIIEGDGGFPKREENCIIRQIKKSALRGAHKYFSSGMQHSDYYEYYGVSSEKILMYPFSSIKEEDILINPLSVEEKSKLRQKLSLPEGRIILYVGQFVYRKGLDILFKALKEIQIKYTLLLIGDSLEAFKKLEIDDHGVNYKVIGFMDKKNLNVYYDSSDFLVLTTREDIWGLVINEAFSRGLPVISSNCSGAAKQLIKNSVNGFKVSNEKNEELVTKIEWMLSNELFSYSYHSLETIKSYTLEKMTEAHISFINI